MGKLRLNCPNCGKAVAVSDTAKKARCPGCKQVMDVAAALAGDLDPAAELKSAGAEAGKAEESPAAAEGAPEKKRSSRRISRASSRKSGRAQAEGADGAPKYEGPPPPTFDLPGGAQPWMIIAGVGLILAIVLFFAAQVEWYAAIAIACGVGLYVDSALMRITRVTPSGQGFRSAPMVWGLIGFSILGVVWYGLTRQKLIESSPEDIATPDMDEDDMSFEGKVRAPSVASVGMVLVLAIAIGAPMVPAVKRSPSTWVKVGTSYKRYLIGHNPQGRYNAGELSAVFHSKKPIADYGGLSWDLLKLASDGTATSVGSGQVKAVETDKPRFATFTFNAEESGPYRLEVKNADGAVYARSSINIRRQ